MRHLPFLTAGIVFCTILLINCNNPIPQQQQINTSSENTKATNDCIQKVFAKDSSLGSIRNHACEQISISETIQQYTKAMAAIDYSDCPSDFTEAFRQHREAWEAMLPVVDHYPGIRGELHELFKILEAGEHAEQFNSSLKLVWDTWADVEKTAGIDKND